MKTIFPLLIWICFTTVSQAQSAKSINDIKALTDSIKVIMNNDHIVGLMLGIVVNDSVIFSGGFGYANLEHKLPVDENTLFRMGSITKMFISLGIMKLAEEGQLKIDDNVKDIAPEVPFHNAWESTHPLKIVHLLEHTSGFDDIQLNAMYSQTHRETHGMEMLLEHKNSMTCRWKPGERVAYSNPNYTILGYLIEKLSGKHYDQYIKDVILGPLKMTHSNFNVSSNLPEDVKEYIFDNGKIKLIPSVTLLGGPQGSLWSCAGDMTKFLRLFLHNGDTLFTPAQLTEMETPHSSLAAKSGLKDGYGLGNSIAFLNSKYPFHGHHGIVGSCHSAFLYNRDLRVGFVLASNTDNPNGRIQQLVVDYLLRAFPENKLTLQALDQHAIAPYLGYYRFGSPRNEIAAIMEKFTNAQHVYVKNGELYTESFFGQPSKLSQVSPLKFAWSDANRAMITFTQNDEGKPVMCFGGTYYEKTTAFQIIGNRTVYIASISISLTSLTLALFSLIAATLRKISWKKLLIYLLPTVGLLALMLAIKNILQVQEHTYRLSEMETINSRTLIIFIGTSLFGIIAVLFLLYSISRFRKITPRWFAWYLLLLGISMFTIDVILFQHGWIGLRTWAM